MCKVIFIVISSLLVLLTDSQLIQNEAIVRASDDHSDSLVSRVLGVPSVWWPVSHLVTNTWSLVAAGLSSAVVGASLLPQIRRMDKVSERIYRGTVARPNSWPWIAKLKVDMYNNSQIILKSHRPTKFKILLDSLM